MLAAFCLRLALGMVAFLPLLPGDKMHPRFFRTQYLTVFGLAVVSLVSFGVSEKASFLDRSFLGILSTAVVLSLLGAVVWSFDPPLFGNTITILSTVLFGSLALCLAPVADARAFPWFITIFEPLVSGLLVGSAVTAMLVGHAYLISPGLTIGPLKAMLIVLAACWMLRVGLLTFTWVYADQYDLTDTFLRALWPFLLPRWLCGILATLIFGLMAYQTARIRSTQSATGILFVVVICTFIGELFGLLLVRMTGLPL